MTNVSIIRSVVVLLAIFVTGLLAGVMLGVAMEQQTAQKLPEAAHYFHCDDASSDCIDRPPAWSFKVGHGRCDSCRASADHRDRRMGSTDQQ
jgi:hypothetical protein